ADEDAAEQVDRWSWVRRPATALWLAFAIHATFPILAGGHPPPLAGRGALALFARGAMPGSLGMFRLIESAAVAWAGLELLAALRAYARRTWTASLRWLVVTDCALAALLVAGGAIAPTASLLLWLAACGGHVFLLAGEQRGAAPRRGAQLTRLWRAASGLALTSLAWPTAISHGSGRLGRLSGLVLPGI